MKTENYIITTNSSGDTYSKKHVFQTVKDNITFEASSFYRPEMNRYDLCISSMAGCLLGCRICQCSYGNAGYERNLSTSEITDQIDFLLDDGKSLINDDTMVLVGFMGNGDPFHNVNEVTEAIRLSHQKYSKTIYRFGISIVGINLDSVRQIANISLQDEIIIWLQFSMICMDEAVRKNILPSSSSIVESTPYLDWYATKTGTPVRYNFPMIMGINDTIEHLNKIVRFVKEKPELRMVKLSSYNEISNKEFNPCFDDVIRKSAGYLRNHGVKVDVFIGNKDPALRGGCGQLRESFLIKP